MVAGITSVAQPLQVTDGRPGGEFPGPSVSAVAGVPGCGVRSAVLRRPSMPCPRHGRRDAGTKYAVGALHAPHTTHD